MYNRIHKMGELPRFAATKGLLCEILLRLCTLLCASSLDASKAKEAVGSLAGDRRRFELGYRDDMCTEAIS